MQSPRPHTGQPCSPGRDVHLSAACHGLTGCCLAKRPSRCLPRAPRKRFVAQRGRTGTALCIRVCPRFPRQSCVCPRRYKSSFFPSFLGAFLVVGLRTDSSNGSHPGPRGHTHYHILLCSLVAGFHSDQLCPWRLSCPLVAHCPACPASPGMSPSPRCPRLEFFPRTPGPPSDRLRQPHMFSLPGVHVPSELRSDQKHQPRLEPASLLHGNPSRQLPIYILPGVHFSPWCPEEPAHISTFALE